MTEPCDTCAAAPVCRALEQPIQEDSLDDGIFRKKITIPRAGTIVPQHSHTYAHTTHLLAGTVLLEAPDRLEVLVAPRSVTIPAFVKHKFTSLTNNATLVCEHDTATNGPVTIHEEHQIVG